VPKDLILSAETVEEHAKVDKHFKELLSAAGGQVRLPQNYVSGYNLMDIVNKGGYFVISADTDYNYMP